MKEQRESGIELLRIIMMIQIIFLHVCDKGGYTLMSHSLGPIHQYLYYMVWISSRCPVFIFFILTGYFLSKSDLTFEKIKNKILEIYKPMIFFSIVIPIFLVLINAVSIKDVNLVKTFFPFLSDAWYFLTGYIIIIALSYFLNKLIKSLTKKEYFILLLIIGFLLCIWNTAASFSPFNSFIRTFQVISNEGGKSLYDYIFMYLLGGYLSLHVKDNNNLNFNYLIAFIACSILQAVSMKLFPGYKVIDGFNDNLFVIIQCICLVLFFRDLKFKSKFINYIATFTLSTYIIHEHYLVKVILWNDIFPVNYIEFYQSYTYPIKIFLICIIVFISCIIIEILRRLLFKLVGSLTNKIKEKCS